MTCNKRNTLTTSPKPRNPRLPVFISDFTEKQRAVLDGKVYPVGRGRTKKEAKREAAKNAIMCLLENEHQDSASFTPTNYMCWLNEYGLKNKLNIRPVESTRLGPNNLFCPDFFVVGEEVYPAVSGKTKKEAKNEAAKLVYDMISSSKTAERVDKDKNMGSRPNETSPQSRFASDFDPMECLGSGAFGCVFKVRHKLLERFYAVKIVRREEKSLREVGTLSDLLHLNIVRYYTFWMEDSGYQWDISSNSCSSSQSADNSPAKYLYIQMELCDTKTLKVWIDEKNAESPQDSKRREESLSIAQQIVSGVEYIHAKKHIHRDLKPDNILFGMEGEVKIGDFGLVTRDDDDDSALMERTGQRGTTSYMAPEQVTKNYDRKVDIFALGLIYFELLWRIATGHERVEIWDDVRSQKFPEEFSVAFPHENQIITSLLCESPEDRPEASKLKAELDTWAQTFNAQNNVSDVSM
uniref:non-specific serine/threonine protein kinase n=1 Tax=Sparus aurata TaxID=8175 RepID=A0A671VPJ3_SPAAU